jgi:hypothetical protein
LKSKRHMENVELGKEESMMGNGGTCKMNNWKETKTFEKRRILVKSCFSQNFFIWT